MIIFPPSSRSFFHIDEKWIFFHQKIDSKIFYMYGKHRRNVRVYAHFLLYQQADMYK